MKRHNYPLRTTYGFWEAISHIQKEAGVKSVNSALEEILKLGIPDFCKNHGIAIPVISEEPTKIEQLSIEKVVEDTK